MLQCSLLAPHDEMLVKVICGELRVADSEAEAHLFAARELRRERYRWVVWLIKLCVF